MAPQVRSDAIQRLTHPQAGSPGEPPHQFGGSHPVPDIPTVRWALGQARSRLAPAAAAAPTFTTDRMNYDASQGEAPVY